MTITNPHPDHDSPTPSDADAAPDRRSGLVASGGWFFLVSAFLGRIPASMVQLGYLMVLHQAGYGMGIAGLAVAVVGLGSAVTAPVVGRLVDRIGPLLVVAGATALSALAQLCFLLLLDRHNAVLLLACAGIVGAANPQIGSITRFHWSHLARRHGDADLVRHALGYEGAVDEIGFVIGPVLASLLVGHFGAHPATIAMLALTAGLQGLFLADLWHEREGWRSSRGVQQAFTGERVRRVALMPVLGCLGVGLLYGATQTALTNIFSARGQAGITGLVYGCVGLGSGLASVLVARLAHRVRMPVRLVAGALLMLAGAVVLMRLPSAVPACAASTVLGLGAGVTLVSSFGVMERLAPRDRVATLLTVLSTSITLGVSGGAALGGQLASVAAHAYWPVLGSVVLTLVAAGGIARARDI